MGTFVRSVVAGVRPQPHATQLTGATTPYHRAPESGEVPPRQLCAEPGTPRVPPRMTKMVQMGPGLAGARNGPKRIVFIKEINKDSWPCRNLEIRLPEPDGSGPVRNSYFEVRLR